ncbi:F-box and leucine-rich repeat protein 13 [Anolis sagrei]|uniref:F-box and leucine-rich repeat protein 13 n=1 Tax=Anolis sagrei TaxID=38937 RepID=UPI00351FE944
MATFQGVGPELRAYFKKHSIPDIYEALLSGLLIMCPDDPLKFLEEKIKEMMEKGVYSILWNMCIDPELSLKLKVISETYLHTLLGLDDDQLMTTELCDKAWDFYSINLKRMCFDAWIKYCAMKKVEREVLQRKFSAAKRFHEIKLLKTTLKKWNTRVNVRKKQRERAAKTLGKVFQCSLQKMILKAWRKETRFRRKAKLYVERVEKGAEDFFFAEDSERHYYDLEPERRHSEKRSSARYPSQERMYTFHTRGGKDHLTKMPGRILAQIFRHLTIIDLARCTQVSRSWKAMIQTGAVWSHINFSAAKEVVKDNIAGNILLKWRTNVVHLNLRGCSTLQWHTFKNMAQCSNLQELNVSECQGLNDELMRLVSEGCPALLYLNLSHTDITNGTLRLLPRGFPNLHYLSLAFCRKFTDKGLQYLGSGRGCHKLIYLDISGCLQITVQGFKNIAKACSGIQHLTINEMLTLTDRCIQALAEKCKQIVSIEFDESPHVSDTTFKALAECKLVKMRIEGCNHVTDQSFKVINKFWPKIKHICVADCSKITDVALKLIAALENITVLNLSHCIRISDAGIKTFVDGHSGSRIRELILANCSYVSDIAVSKIAQRCHSLIYLNLSHCRAVTDSGVEALIMMPSLAYINISGIDVTDQALETLGRLSKLKEIIISECQHISDGGVKRFCVDLKRLDYMDFSFCHQLSNHSLKNLTFNCRKITSLSMAGCTKISDVGIQFVAAGCSFLHYLDISGCLNITDRGLRFLWKGCPQLRILKMLYCKGITRQAVLKFCTKLQKYEYNDDDPPLWFSYTVSDSPSLKKHSKGRHSTSSPERSISSPPEKKLLESPMASAGESSGEKISEASKHSALKLHVEKSAEPITPPTISEASKHSALKLHVEKSAEPITPPTIEISGVDEKPSNEQTN